MLYSIISLLPLLGTLLFGLVLLSIGIVLMLKVKNKLAGILVIAVGLVFTVFPIAIFLFLTITTSVRS
jgi:uncharacterized membrane protein